MAGTVDEGVERLAAEFASRFPERLDGPRTVGREAEFPLVTPDGRAGDSASLWPLLLEEPGAKPVHDQPAPDGTALLIGVETETWFCLAEVGRGTVEIGIGPRTSLHELAGDLDVALAAVGGAARRCGYRMLAYGIQPRTPPVPSLMTPKRRYLALLEVVGPTWLRFALTASDQLHAALDRNQLVLTTNLMNATSGALIAVAANSSVYGGRPGAACGREGLMAGMVPESFRHGAVPRAFHDVEDYVRWVVGFRCLALPDGRGGFRFPAGTYADELARAEADFAEFLYHEHYLWPGARPRALLGTLEIRPACQQPGASFAAAAFALGLIEARPEAWAYLEDALGPDAWGALLAYRRRAVRDGIRAEEPAPGFLGTLLDLAELGLRMRGLGEQDLLSPLHERLERRNGPADHARELFRSVGMGSLVGELALPSPA